MVVLCAAFPLHRGLMESLWSLLQEQSVECPQQSPLVAVLSAVAFYTATALAPNHRMFSDFSTLGLELVLPRLVTCGSACVSGGPGEVT